jgi:hypothetical protein
MAPDAAVETEKARNALIVKLAGNWPLAHAVVFRHRHGNDTPAFHRDIIQAWHSPTKEILVKAFRGGAKSTIGEEAVTLRASYGMFRNAIIIGSSSDRAVERLRAIKHELENNTFLHELFGPQIGSTWNEDKIVMANGVCIQAVGRGQSLRGTKYLDMRPDYVLGDDMEDEESTANPEAIMKFKTWFMAVVYAALDPGFTMRVLGTPLAPGCFVDVLSAMSGWLTLKYPSEFIDKQTGARTAMWPGRYPLEELDRIKQRLGEAGTPHVYAQEYLMETEDASKKTFKEQHFKVVPTVRTWHPTLAIFDPARTANVRTSATTGHVVGSWIGRKLVLWEADGRFLMPDQIVSEVFRVEEQYRPASIGVEEDGLNEFLMQPLRAEQIKRGVILPLQPLLAPKNMSKFRFIEALQPYFAAGEVEFAQPMPTLKAQLLGFPGGRIDAPNALAYFLKLRPGQLIFDHFSSLHVSVDLPRSSQVPMYLAVNGTQQYTTGILCQYDDGVLKILADWVRDGAPGLSLGSMVRQASLEAGQPLRLVAPAKHWREVDNVGLAPAAMKVPVRITQGGPEAKGREELRSMMRLVVRDFPAVRVSMEAHWTLNGFGSGYVCAVEHNGVVSKFAEDNVYKVLIEGLEAFAALLQSSTNQDMGGEANYAYTASGVPYLTTLPRGKHGTQELKVTGYQAQRR